MLATGGIDAVLGVLFVIAYLKTPRIANAVRDANPGTQ